MQALENVTQEFITYLHPTYRRDTSIKSVYSVLKSHRLCKLYQKQCSQGNKDSNIVSR